MFDELIDKLYLKLRGAWRSLTMWFNGAIAVTAAMLPTAIDQLPLLKAYVPHNLYAWAFVAAVVGNILLRCKTNSALENK